MNHNAENFTSLKLLLAKHRKAKFAGKSLRARTIFAQRRPKSPLSINQHVKVQKFLEEESQSSLRPPFSSVPF